jgi:hypothetical protein
MKTYSKYKNLKNEIISKLYVMYIKIKKSKDFD